MKYRILDTNQCLMTVILWNRDKNIIVGRGRYNNKF